MISNPYLYKEQVLKINPEYMVVYDRIYKDFASPGAIEPKHTQSDVQLFIQEFYPPQPVFLDKEEPKSHPNSIANLLQNEHKGYISSKSVKRLYNAMDWFLLISKEKAATKFHNNKWFRYKLAMITLTLPCNQYEIGVCKECPLLKTDYCYCCNTFRGDKWVKHHLLNNFFSAMRKKYNLVNYIWKAEKQQNGSIHFHIVMDKYIVYDELNRVWNTILEHNGYIEEYRLSQKEWHKNGFRPRPELFKHWGIKAQIKAWNQGTATNWSNPTSTTDIHSLKKVRNAKGYLGKYLVKNPDHYKLYKKKVAEAVAENGGHSIEPSIAASIYQAVKDSLKVDGNLWYISQSLSKLKGCVTSVSSEIKDELIDIANEFKDKVYNSQYFWFFKIPLKTIAQRASSILKDKIKDYITAIRDTFYPPGSSRYEDLGIPLMIFE